MNSPKRSYHPISVLMHWASALLVVICFATIAVGMRLPRTEMARTLLLRSHEISGQLIFIINILRLSVFHAFGAPSPDGSDFQQVHVARCLHILLYGAVGFLAATGSILTACYAAGHTVLGYTIPMLLSASGLGLMRELHQTASIGFILVCFVHALASLAIHYFGNRSTLQKMKLDAEAVDYIVAPETQTAYLRMDANETSH